MRVPEICRHVCGDQGLRSRSLHRWFSLPQAWSHSRGKLLTAATPAMRAENALAMLSEEANKFSALEEQLTAAKGVQTHMHR